MTKKTIIVAAVLLLAAALFVGAVSADGEVAQIGDTSYPSLAAAIAAVQPGETITMIADSTENPIDWLMTDDKKGKFTIDFDNHKWTVPNEMGVGSNSKNQAFRIQLPNVSSNPTDFEVVLKNGEIIGQEGYTYIATLINSYVTLNLENFNVNGSAMTRENYIYGELGDVFVVVVETGSCTLTESKLIAPVSNTDKKVRTGYALYTYNGAGSYPTSAMIKVTDNESQLDGNVYVEYRTTTGGWSQGVPVLYIPNVTASLTGNFDLKSSAADPEHQAVLDFGPETTFEDVAPKINTAPNGTQLKFENSDPQKPAETLTFTEQYTKPTDESKIIDQIKSKTTQSSGTTVILTVDLSYEFSIPSSIPLSTTEGGTQPVGISLKNLNADVPSKMLMVKLMTAGTTSATTYEVKKVGKPSVKSTYEMTVNDVKLETDSTVLEKSVGTVGMVESTINFTTLTLGSEAGIYEGTLSFEVTVA